MKQLQKASTRWFVTGLLALGLIVATVQFAPSAQAATRTVALTHSVGNEPGQMIPSGGGQSQVGSGVNMQPVHANLTALHWISNPGQHVCWTFCSIQWSAPQVYNILLTAWTEGVTAGALSACSGYYNGALLQSLGWACLWFFAYDSATAYGDMSNCFHNGNGCIMWWVDEPGLPFYAYF